MSGCACGPATPRHPEIFIGSMLGSPWVLSLQSPGPGTGTKGELQGGEIRDFAQQHLWGGKERRIQLPGSAQGLRHLAALLGSGDFALCTLSFFFFF